MTHRTSKEINAMNTPVPTPRHRKGALAAFATAAVFALSGCAAYQLPPEPARYTLETQTNGVKTVWQYTSAQVTKDVAPEQQPCTGEVIGTNHEPCRPEPLIFLRYDLDLALDKTAKAGDTHEITITGYYQQSLTALPKVTTLKAEASFDGGKTWHSAATRAQGRNTFSTKIEHPRRDRAADGVALRINASDSEGNTVKQTLPTAYKLR
ncbi:hypothetical protein ADL00_37160 [Streptomyces sp. AS58]|uniref:hypothetical protein n=1 Tax=Streptomyces sp. AS58 TaxID=1519489 RepID=UPI0006AECECD|nr:hypothetical protein [Streptomyces sp. AS58]KOV52561.1 hypothetical protein ADL00_37160 [Streptomyces sp. AS58]